MDDAAAAAVGFDADAALGVGEGAILDGEIGDSAGDGAADGDAVTVAVGAMFDVDIRGAAAAGEIIIADADVAVFDQDVAAGDIAGVGVVTGVDGIGGSGGADRHAAHGDIGRMPTDGDMEHRRILELDTLDEDVIAFAEDDHARPADAGLSFDEWPPWRALAVDRALAGDGDIVEALAVDEAVGGFGSAGVFIDGEHLERCAGVEAQVDCVSELQRPGQILAGGDFYGAATGGGSGFDCRLDGLGAICVAAGDRAVVGDLENCFGDLGQRRIGGCIVGHRRWHGTKEQHQESGLEVTHNAVPPL